MHGLLQTIPRRMLLAFVVFLLPSIGFVWLSKEVRDQETLQFDTLMLEIVRDMHTAWFDRVVVAVTQLGGAVCVIIVTLCVAYYLWQKMGKAYGMLVLFGVLGASVLNLALKAIFSRPRPELWERIVSEASFSFPSGHAMASASLAMSILLAVWTTRARLPVLLCGAVYVLAIGFTRLYLGVHYPTDVMAGWMVSVAWVTVVYGVLYRAGKLT